MHLLTCVTLGGGEAQVLCIQQVVHGENHDISHSWASKLVPNAPLAHQWESKQRENRPFDRLRANGAPENLTNRA